MKTVRSILQDRVRWRMHSHHRWTEAGMVGLLRCACCTALRASQDSAAESFVWPLQYCNEAAVVLRTRQVLAVCVLG